MRRGLIFVLMYLLFVPVTLAQTDVIAQNAQGENFESSLPASQTTNENILEPRPINQVIDDQIEVEEAGESGEAGLPQFNTETYTSQLFWLAISFIILYFFFARKTLPSISAILETRQSTVRNDLEQADILSSEADKTKAEYEAMIVTARNNAAKERQALEQSIREKSEQDTVAFNERSMTAIQNIETQVEAKKNQIKSELDNVATDLVEQIINKLTDINVAEQDILAAVQSELSETTVNNNKKAA